MILSSNLGWKTHYEIIGVKEDASQEEIRRTYRSALLNFHPDKLPNTSETSNRQFLEVQGAWKVLGDPTSRALYDNDLRKSRQDDAVTADVVSLEDMIIEDDGTSFVLCNHCRCGDLFSIDSSELAEMGYPFSRNGSEISFQAPSSSPASIVLPCGSCSLKFRLIIDASVKLQVELNN